MEVTRFMGRVCIILIPTCVSEAAENRQIINRINMKMRPSTEGVKLRTLLDTTPPIDSKKALKEQQSHVISV